MQGRTSSPSTSNLLRRNWTPSWKAQRRNASVTAIADMITITSPASILEKEKFCAVVGNIAKAVRPRKGPSDPRPRAKLARPYMGK
jgi:hypothetical protein